MRFGILKTTTPTSSKLFPSSSPFLLHQKMSTSTKVHPPVAKRVPHTVYFGKTDDVDETGHSEDPNKIRAIGNARSNTLINPPIQISDPLFWLRDDERKNPEMLEHLRSENKYFEEKTKDQKALAEQIYKEHVSHTKETDDSCPVTHGSWVYWEKTFEGKSYKIHVRAPVGSGAEETLLDINALAEGRSQCDVHALRVDPKHHAVFAYSLDLVGDECYNIYFKKCANFSSLSADEAKCYGNQDIETKVIGNTDGDIVWLPNSDAIVYTTRDESKRTDKIWLHRLAEPDTKNDVLLFHEPNQLYSVGANVTRDGQYLTISVDSYEGDEFHFLPLYKINNDPAKITGPESFKVLKKRKENHHYRVFSWNAGHFLVVSDDDGAKTNKVVYVNEEHLDDWSNVIVPYAPERTIDAVLCLKNGLVFEGRAEGLTQLWTSPVVESARNYATSSTSPDFFKSSFGLADSSSSSNNNNLIASNNFHMMKNPEPLYQVDLLFSAAKTFASDTFRINYSSMVTPNRFTDVNLLDPLKRTVVKEKEVPGGYDPSNYICERRWATAADGTRIPLSVLRRRSTVIPTEEQLKDEAFEPAQRSCVHLYGYGSYGISIEPAFKISPLPLLDRGIVYIIAHVRGGGEMGKDWYETGGKLLTKRNTFSDFIACLESIVHEHKITTAKQIAIEGRSAGGLLVGAVMNMRPDLFNCLVSGVGFVDVLCTMSDAAVPLTTQEWQTFGNPNIYQLHHYMRSYCPVQNVTRQKYPAGLFTAGLADPRVPYWEVAKFVQKLRENTLADEDENELIAKFEMEAGHFSANDRYKYLRELAIDQAWVIKRLTGKTQ